MKISILTLFPEMFEPFINTSIIGRSIEKGVAEVEAVQIRDFSKDKHHHTDDTPFGGGKGMVMMCQPVLDCLDSVRTEDSYVILTSPAGHVFDQKKAHELAEKKHLVILCGHYEGMDYRITKHVDELISIGDYVLTGGELPAMVISDAVIRLQKGSLAEGSADEESHENGLLEYPQYTQPADYKGDKVPQILLSGHHENIRKWRILQSLKMTQEMRPDLYEKHELSEEEKKILEKAEEE